MFNVPRALLAISGASLLAAPAAWAQQTVYAIGNGGTTLIRFQSDNPGDVMTIGNFGGASTFLDGISFRPATGELYGYLDSTDSFYTVNLTTARLTLASTSPSGAPTNTFQLGMAFNAATDRARLVTDSAQNIVFNPTSGTTAAATDLSYAVGDPNEFASPSVIDNAYTQNRPGGDTPQQYGIDYGIDALVRIANDAGTLTTVGVLGTDTDIYTGFDIFTNAGGQDTAYAILTPLGGVPSFYAVNLNTGGATLVGALGFTNQVYGLAVIPAPSALGVLFPGVLLLAHRGRRR